MPADERDEIERDELIERVSAELQRPVSLSPDVSARIMAAVTPLAWRGRWAASAVGLAAAAAVVFALSPRRHQPTIVVFSLPDTTAHQVAVVGDFNHWDVHATPLAKPKGHGWRIAVPLSPGRHVYAFVVDGTRWVLDPAAPKALDDDYGTPNSVVTVVPGGAT